MNLIAAYEDLCEARGYQADRFQLEAARRLEAFARAAAHGKGKHGLYVWGQVGRGKTMLMDLLYREFPVAQKRRIHFHALIREIRDRLAIEMGPNPMRRVAMKIAPARTLLCIDEMHVSDLDNALVVEVFLTELVRNRLVIVTTSNFSPDDLLPDEIGGARTPLFMSSREETLRMIHRHFELVELEGDQAYRRLEAAGSGGYFDNRAGGGRLGVVLARSNAGRELESKLTLFGREMRVVRRFERALWLDYAEVCEGLWSYRDYLEMLAGIDLLLVDHVDIRTLDGAKRFGWLVEVAYDGGKGLVLASGGEREALFSNVPVPSHLRVEFDRVLSRVIEMTR